MMWPEFYLLCFCIGALWAAVSLLLGGAHFGHLGHFHGGGGHAGHAHGGSHGPLSHWAMSLVNPSCLAVFLVWFGGAGYLLTRHSGWGFWLNTIVALLLGFSGAAVLAAFLRFLQSREQPMNPADYQMAGVLGRVSCPIRADGGVGEVIYVRDGSRRLVPAKSEGGAEIARGEEVVVTRYEKGIAYVRTWADMLR